MSTLLTQEDRLDKIKSNLFKALAHLKRYEMEIRQYRDLLDDWIVEDTGEVDKFGNQIFTFSNKNPEKVNLVKSKIIKKSKKKTGKKKTRS